MSQQETWDLHAHFVPPTLVENVRADRSTQERLKTEVVDGQEWLVRDHGRQTLQPGLYDVEARLRDMDANGIDVAVISLQPSLYSYGARADEAINYAAMVNDEIAATVALGGKRLRGLAHLPMQDPDAAARELERAHGQLGLAGCQVGPIVNGQTLDDADFAALLETLERLAMPVTLHPYTPVTKGWIGLGQYNLGNTVGHPYQTCLGASRLIVSGALDRFPSLEVVLMHGGGFFPYQVGRLDHSDRVRPGSAASSHRPSTYLQRFTFDTLTHSPASLQFLKGLVGADRIAYGTDYPFDMGGGTVADHLSGMDATEHERDRIRGANAERLYDRRIEAGVREAMVDRPR